MTPKTGYLPMLAMFIVATAVSFAIAFLLIRGDKAKDDAADAAQDTTTEQHSALGAASANSIMGDVIDTIVIACDAGMGSSVMVAR